MLKAFGIIPDQMENECYRNLPKSQFCRHPEYELEFITDIMKMLKWEYEFVETTTYGYLDPNSEVPKWTGLIGLALDDKIDIGAHSMRVIEERQNAVEFSYPVWYFQQCFKYIKKNEIIINNFLLAPFQKSLWIYIVLILLFLVCFHILFSALLQKLSGNKITWKSNYIYVTWQYLIQLCRQYYTVREEWASLMVLVQNWILATMIITVCYQCKVTSQIAIPAKPSLLLETWRDLLDGVKNDKFQWAYFEPNAILLLCGKLCDETEKLIEQIPILPLKDMELEQNHVTFDTYELDQVPYKSNFDPTDQEFVIVKQKDSPPLFGSFVLNSNWTRKREFNEALVKSLPGARNIAKWYSYQRMLENAYVKMIPTNSSFKLKNLAIVFILLAAGLLLSTTIFIFEIFGPRSKTLEQIPDTKTAFVTKEKKSIFEPLIDFIKVLRF